MLGGVGQQRRYLKQRREYLYRKSLEGKEREWYEKKRRIRQALQEGKPIPTELRNEEAKLRVEIDLENEQTAGHALNIVAAERVVLNFVQRMSGIATLTKVSGLVVIRFAGSLVQSAISFEMNKCMASVVSRVKENYEALEARYEALHARVAALEKAKTVETTTTVEGSE